MPQKADDPNFRGFRQPKESWSKLPHQFVELLPQFDALTELKVTIYILRHTWGYREYGKKKRLTVDDFVNGRKRSNGERIDNGTGLSEQGVRDGLKRAIAHGFVVCHIDDSDKARVKKYYGLNLATAQKLATSGVQSLDPQTFDPYPQTLYPNPQTVVPRTKKETKERNSKKDNAPVGDKPIKPFDAMKNAIHAAFGYDAETTTNETWVLIGKAASSLLKAQATPEDMTGLYKYCASRFDNFGAMALANAWTAYAATRKSSTPAATADNLPPYVPSMDTVSIPAYDDPQWSKRHD